MRAGLFTFKDDMTGYKGLAFFLVSAFIIFFAGLTCGTIGIFLKKRSVISIIALMLNLTLLVGGYLMLKF